MLFSKWNSFSRIAVYDRAHGDWSLSPTFTGARGDSLFMDIDSAASTPILKGTGQAVGRRVSALRADGPRLPARRATRWIHGAGHRSRRRTRSAVGARVRRHTRRWRRDQPDHRARRDARPLPRLLGQPLRRSASVAIHVDDGRSFVRRSTATYDVIQASLVDTWAATAAGAYTLTENSLYTSEAFGEYLDHLTDNGVLTITRWVFDGLRLVSLAQEACAARGLDPARHLAIVRHDRVATFLLKKQPFTPQEVERLTTHASAMGFAVLYAPGVRSGRQRTDPPEMIQSRHERRRLRAIHRGHGSSAVHRGLSARHPSRRPTIGRSSSTRRDWPTSSTSPSADRCCSATA